MTPRTIFVLAPTRSTYSPVLVLFFATGLAAVANFITQIVLARTLGPDQFGAFFSALAIATFLAPLAGFGLSGLWLRVFGEEGYSAQRWMPASLFFVTLSAIIVVSLLFLWAWIGPHPPLKKSLLIILSGVTLAHCVIDLVGSKFQLEGKYQKLAIWQLTSHPLRLFGILLVLLVTPELTVYDTTLIFLIVSAIICLLGAYQLRHLFSGNYVLEGHIKSVEIKSESSRRLSKPSLIQVFKAATPFGLEGFLFVVYYQTDIIVLSYLTNNAESGLYSVATVVMSAACLLPSVAYQQYLLPKFHRWAYSEGVEMAKKTRLGSIQMFLVGTLVMILIFITAGPLVPAVFGSSYQSSVTLLQILAIAIPFRYLNTHLGSILKTRDFIWTSVKATFFTAALNVVLNFVLISQYGTFGAAVATLTSYIVLSILFLLSASKSLTQDIKST